MLQALCADYGFRSGSGRLYQEDYGEVPKSAGELVSDRTKQSTSQGFGRTIGNRLVKPYAETSYCTTFSKFEVGNLVPALEVLYETYNAISLPGWMGHAPDHRLDAYKSALKSEPGQSQSASSLATMKIHRHTRTSFTGFGPNSILRVLLFFCQHPLFWHV